MRMESACKLRTVVEFKGSFGWIDTWQHRGVWWAGPIKTWKFLLYLLRPFWSIISERERET